MASYTAETEGLGDKIIEIIGGEANEGLAFLEQGEYLATARNPRLKDLGHHAGLMEAIEKSEEGDVVGTASSLANFIILEQEKIVFTDIALAGTILVSAMNTRVEFLEETLIVFPDGQASREIPIFREKAVSVGQLAEKLDPQVQERLGKLVAAYSKAMPEDFDFSDDN